MEVSFKIIFKVLTSIVLFATLLNQKSFATFQEKKDQLEELVEKQDYQTLWNAFITYFNEKPKKPQEILDYSNFLEWIRSKAEEGHVPCTMFYAYKTIMNGIKINDTTLLNEGFAYAFFSILQTQIDASTIDPNYALEEDEYILKNETINSSNIVARFFINIDEVINFYKSLNNNKRLTDCFHILDNLLLRINHKTLPNPFWVAHLGYDYCGNRKFNKIVEHNLIVTEENELENRRIYFISQAMKAKDYIRF